MTQTDLVEDQEIYRFFLGWLAGERGRNTIALDHFKRLRKSKSMGAYACAGEAFIHFRQRDNKQARIQIEKARKQVDAKNSCLLATLDHCEANICISMGTYDVAHNFLSSALSRFGKTHFATGRVLDSFGYLYSMQNRFFDAEKFYLLALDHKQEFQDSVGLALTHGQLGRLYLSWGKLVEAERHFKKDLNLSHKLGDIRGLSQIYNFLALVFLERNLLDGAKAYVDESLRWNNKLEDNRSKSFALKDKAAILLAQNKLNEAEQACGQSEELVGDKDPYALAFVNRVWGGILREQKEYSLSELRLHESIGYFEQNEFHDEAAKSIFELSQTLVARGTEKILISDCLLRGIEQADKAKRPWLVHQASEMLAEHDEAAFQKRQLERVQGPGLTAHGLLEEPKMEFATVIFLDVRDYTPFVRNEDASTVMTFMNQLFGEMNRVMEKFDISANQYLGDGFMAICRGKSHPIRAVESAFELLNALEKVNQPRSVLGLQELECRIGIASGSILTGYVGTYNKVDYTAVGAITNLAARLQSLAPPNGVCVSNETYRRVRGKLKTPKPEKINLEPKGFEDEGGQDVWKFHSPNA